MRSIKIIIFIKGSFLIINRMARECFMGLLMAKFMKVNGVGVVSRAMGYGRVLMGIRMLVNG